MLQVPYGLGSFFFSWAFSRYALVMCFGFLTFGTAVSGTLGAQNEKDGHMERGENGRVNIPIPWVAIWGYLDLWLR